MRKARSIDRILKRLNDRIDSSYSVRLVEEQEEKEKVIIKEDGATLPRDLKLEASFKAMAHERVINYERKYGEMWDTGIINNDNFLKFTAPGLDTSYWESTQEEKDYYYNENRSPRPKSIFDADHPPRIDIDISSLLHLHCR